MVMEGGYLGFCFSPLFISPSLCSSVNRPTFLCPALNIFHNRVRLNLLCSASKRETALTSHCGQRKQAPQGRLTAPAGKAACGYRSSGQRPALSWACRPPPTYVRAPDPPHEPPPGEPASHGGAAVSAVCCVRR